MAIFPEAASKSIISGGRTFLNEKIWDESGKVLLGFGTNNGF